MALTRKQISSLTEFSERKLHEGTERKLKVINDRLKQYGLNLVVTPDSILNFYKVIVPNLAKETRREYFIKSKEGVIDSHYTPTDISKTDFEKVENPEIDRWYHLSWAFKGAKFQLKEINGEKGIVWTGKTNNKKLSINLCDLRHFSR